MTQRYFGAFASQSKVSQDYNNLYKPLTQNSELNHQQPRPSASLKNAIPDYELNHLQTGFSKKYEFTKAQLMEKHPLDLASESNNFLEYPTLQSNELYFFNLPKDTTEESLRKLCTLRGVQILDLNIKKCIDQEKIAYARIKLENPKQAKQIKDKFYNYWIGDKKIKVKSREEMNYESYDNRTLVVRNIPNNYKQKELHEIFSNFGGLVSIEVPLINLALKEQIKNKADLFLKEKREKRERDFRLAQAVVKESIEENPEIFKNFLSEHLEGAETDQLLLNYQEETTNQKLGHNHYEFLDQQRQSTIFSILTTLQSESKEVSSAIDQISQLRTLLNAEESPIPSISNLPQRDNYEQVLESKKSTVTKAIDYLDRNRENLDESSLSLINELMYQSTSALQKDPLEKLHDLSRSDLAKAYDQLLEALEQRENLIKQRIKNEIYHLGIEERILFQGKDFKRETEDISNPDDVFGNYTQIEEFLSVNEQVDNVREFKYMSPEDKLFQIVQKKFNPFLEANFNKIDLAYNLADHQEMKDYPHIDPTLPPSVAQLLFKGAPYKKEFNEIIKAKVEKLRDQFDLPFDELYHKERKLVDNVIKAELALKKKIENLPSPMGESTVNVDELGNDINLNPILKPQHQFYRDQKVHEIQKAQIDGDSGDATYQHLLTAESEIDKLLLEGKITQKEYDEYVSMVKELNEVNQGYAFVTYSHTDETKLAAILASNLVADGMEVETIVKGNLGHKDFDKTYKLNKQKNESKLVDEYQRLREAKAELRDFERNIEKDLPSLKKLKRARQVARDAIEKHQSQTRNLSWDKRTQEEEELLNQKIRDLQRENPDVDMTQLFDTERAELARKAQHKKAFASYKAFQFLKHGVEMQAKLKKDKDDEFKFEPTPFKKLDNRDPYDFPPINETVAKFLTKDKYPREIDSGDIIDKPGRKFGYTEEEFFEAYFGKDFSRQIGQTNYDEQLFGINESLKKKFPVEKYLHEPVVQKLRSKLHDRVGITPGGDEARDQLYEQFMMNLDYEKEDTVVDKPHPTIPGRTYLTDLENRLTAFVNKRTKKLDEEYISYNPRDIGMIRKSVREEYFPKKAKEAATTAPPEDTKVTEKFEPHYENERATTQDQISEDEMDDSPIASDPQTTKKRERTRRDQNEEFEVEFNNDFSGDKQAREANKDFLYKYKHITRNYPDEYDSRYAPIKLQRLEKAADYNDLETEELFEALKNTGNIADGNSVGPLGQKDRLKMLQDERDFPSRQRKQRNIQDFAKESESEREDEDIYAHYLNEMKKAQKEKAQEHQNLTKEQKIAQLSQENLEKMLPEVPRFEGFFRSQSQGEHPFEGDQYKYNQDDLDEQFRQEDEKYDEELLERELQGRLIGETLTPRQFATLYKARLDEKMEIQFMKDKERKQFIQHRDLVRIIEELKEKIRRQKVQAGEWSEKESYKQLEQFIQEKDDEIPNTKEDARIDRTLVEAYKLFMHLRTQKQVYEREYYFDENLGESVQQHVDRIKKDFPEVEVLMRRDRDGFPIIKTLYKQKFRNDLESTLNYDPEEGKKIMKETMDDVLKTVINHNGTPEENIQELAQDALKYSLGQGDEQQSIYRFDDQTRDKLNELIEERIVGKYKNNREGFIDALKKFSQDVKVDKSRKLQPAPFFNLNSIQNEAQEEAISQMKADKERLTYEFMEQIQMRVKEHLFYKERKPSDFIKPRRNEANLFASQVYSNENALKSLENDNLDLLRAGDKGEQTEGFDKEAYLEIKAEIKRRREAKARLLEQGFPELRPYVAI